MDSISLSQKTLNLYKQMLELKPFIKIGTDQFIGLVQFDML